MQQSAPDDALLRLAATLRDGGYRFVTPTPATHALVNRRPGNAWARDVRDVFGWSRPFRDGVLAPGLVELMREADVLAPAGEGWRSLVRLSSLARDGGKGREDELLFLHSAFPTDAADAVFFGPDTTRFAAALGAHLASNPAPVRRAVDIGCGSGPGAVLIALAHPGAEVLAVDINDTALRLTRVNAALAGAGVVPCRSDLLRDVDGAFDLIVSNPPYLVDPGARAYRHGGGPLGAELSLAIVAAAPARLAPGGTLLLYTGAAVVNGTDPFRTAVTDRLSGRGVSWTYREVDPDVFGEELVGGAYDDADRIAAVVLTAKKME